MTSRPNGRERAQRSVEDASAGHLQHDVDGAALVGLDQGVAQVGRVAGDRPRVERDVGTEVAGEVPLLRRGGGRDDAAGAQLAGQLHGEAADAAGSRVHDDRLAGRHPGAGAQQVPRRGALQHERERGGVVDPSGSANVGSRVGQRLLGVPAGGHQRDHPAPVRVDTDHLGARHERERLRREVVVGRLVGVGVVDAGRGDVESSCSGPAALGAGRSTSSRTSGPPNCLTWMARIGADPNPAPRRGCVAGDSRVRARDR